MRRWLVVPLGALFLCWGCAANSVSSSGSMSTGERLYRANCASCHSLRSPADYTDEQWESYVAKYGQELKLPQDKQGLILQHLQSSN